jgi:3'-5' exoribonuclease
MKIEEIIAEKEINKSMTGTFIISDITTRAFTEKDGSFLTFILQDKTGRIQGKIWEKAETFKIQDDSVVTITGKINLYKGKNQIIVESAKVEKEYDISDFLPASKINCEEMFKELCLIMDKIKDINIRLIWRNYLSDENFVKEFKLCPAGKGDVHHAYLHGLIEHSLSAVKICDFFSDHFKGINKDIVLMGAFLHDLGKIEAYKYEAAIKMSDFGRLHGHTSLGYYSFLKRMDEDELKTKIPIEEREELKKILGHMILSHHGSFESQASAVPMIREAILLAEADSIDADINHVTKILETVKDNWTSYDNLRGKMYYQKQEKKEEIKEEKEPKKIIRKKNVSTLFDYNEKV